MAIIKSNKRVTPREVTELKENEIFVFGSKLNGRHYLGDAARLATEKFGAVWGEGVGRTGQCYGIPTMDGGIDAIKPHVDVFTDYAQEHPELTFLVTKVGCGVAGYKIADIAPLFKKASLLDNVYLPLSFWRIL